MACLFHHKKRNGCYCYNKKALQKELTFFVCQMASTVFATRPKTIIEKMCVSSSAFTHGPLDWVNIEIIFISLLSNTLFFFRKEPSWILLLLRLFLTTTQKIQMCTVEIGKLGLKLFQRLRVCDFPTVLLSNLAKKTVLKMA